MMHRKNKSFKEIELLWPNVTRMVKDAEEYLDDLVCPGECQKASFVQQCAIKAAKKASAIEYTDDYTYRKLLVFCDEFRENLLELERMTVQTRSGRWTPDRGPFSEFHKESGDYTVTAREKAVKNEAYRAKIDAWIKSHV